MNISPILLLSIGSTFAILYGLIITIGWAVTRKNRKSYHKAIGYSEVELFDLNDFKPLGVKIKTVSFENNLYISGDNARIDFQDFDCYMIETPSSKYPKLQKGNLILIEPSSDKIKYAFNVPDLKRFR